MFPVKLKLDNNIINAIGIVANVQDCFYLKVSLFWTPPSILRTAHGNW
jgi:hypothetical protein